MADTPRYPGSHDAAGDDGGAERVCKATPDTPRWVYVFGIIAVVLVMLFGILHLAGLGLGEHAPSDVFFDGRTTGSNATERAISQP